MSRAVGRMRAGAGHAWLMVRLNFRSPSAVLYGYLMPVLFLIAFGSVFRGEQPALWHEMGQILTISLLGGASLGFPTALVAERERGVWRRYQLLPVSVGPLLGSVVAARWLILASMAVVQVVLARLLFGTPWPLHPLELAVAFLFVTFAFLGLGLLVAALAKNVPAVQALGQCIFLPMVLIGGVGVPLDVLPLWAQRLAAFMPGRHAVEALQVCYSDPRGLALAPVSLVALMLVGFAAGLAGLRLFHGEAGLSPGRSRWVWAAVALAAWAAAGGVTVWTGHALPLTLVDSTWSTLTPAQIAAIDFAGLPGDQEFVSRLAPPFQTHAELERARALSARLHQWEAGRNPEPGPFVRDLVAVATLADVSRDPREADFARVIFDELQSRVPPGQLQQALAWVILEPGAGTVPTVAPELGLNRPVSAERVRQRSVLYAKKFLGRLRGAIGEPGAP